MHLIEPASCPFFIYFVPCVLYALFRNNEFGILFPHLFHSAIPTSIQRRAPRMYLYKMSSNEKELDAPKKRSINEFQNKSRSSKRIQRGDDGGFPPPPPVHLSVILTTMPTCEDDISEASLPFFSPGLPSLTLQHLLSSVDRSPHLQSPLWPIHIWIHLFDKPISIHRHR